MAKADKRKALRHTVKLAEKHITAQGGVVYAANLLQDSFFNTFLTAIALERPFEKEDNFAPLIRFYDHAISIWHIIQSDKAQREMATQAISTVPTKLKLRPMISRLDWAARQSADFAEYRNLIAHSPIMFSYWYSLKRGKLSGKWVPEFSGHGTRPIHRKKLDHIASLRFWEMLRDDLVRLSQYVSALNVQIHRLAYAAHGAELADAPKTLPYRPRLPSLQRVREINRLVNMEGRVAGPLKRRRPRRASRK